MDKSILDKIINPSHYNGSIECIDAMEEVIGKDGVINFCIGNAFKYLWRCNKKHSSPVVDINKAKWYIDKAVELMDDTEDK